MVAGAGEAADQSWLLAKRFPLDGGINGLAAQQGEPVWTSDYLADPRIPHEADDTEVAERLGLRGMASAPLRAPGGEVIGTLAISTARPRTFADEELDLLQGLADQAAIAITNSTLLTRLTESEARYRYLIERAPDLVWSIGPDARLTFLSDAVVRLTGRQPGELLGEHFGALVHESSSDVASFDWTSRMETGTQEVRGRVNLAGADGEPIPAEFIAAARLDENGRFLGANGSVRDMREQERLEQELRDSEGRYRFLVENSPDVVFSTDAEGRFTFMSDSMERMTGWRPDQLVGEHFSKVVERDSVDEASSRWTALTLEPAREQIALLILEGSDGRRVPVEVSAIGMVDDDGRFAGIHGATRDISERARLERELRRQAGELAAGEERAHLARELHDSVTQALFSMTLVSRSVEMLLDRDTDAARVQLTQLRDLQREALAEMRALIFELRPGNLEQDGLIRALRTHTAAIQGRIGLPVVVETSFQDRLPLAIEEVLYRIAQEALHNVIKHAAARQVRVDLARSGAGVRLRIEDDGKGFDPLRVPDGHLGLAGMRARADRIGAEFTCRSAPGRGTTIEVVVPEATIDAAGAPTGPAVSSAIRDSWPPIAGPFGGPHGPTGHRHSAVPVAVGRRFRLARRPGEDGGMPTAPLPPTSPIRVVVVDGDDLVRETVAALLGIGDRVEVVGIAGQAGPAIDLVRTARPDVVIVDPRLPDLDDGLAFIRDIHAVAPSVRVLIVCSPELLARRRAGGRSRSLPSQDVPARRSDRGHRRGQPIDARLTWETGPC